MRLLKYEDILGGTRPFEVPTDFIPKCVGLYFFTELIDNEETITYIGSTYDLRGRLTRHHHILKQILKDGGQYRIYIAPCHYSHMRITESKLIYKVKPKRNSHCKLYHRTHQWPVKEQIQQLKLEKMEVRRADAQTYMQQEINRRLSQVIY